MKFLCFLFPFPFLAPRATQRPSALENGKYFVQDGTKMRYWGKDPKAHFAIDHLALKQANRTETNQKTVKEKFPNAQVLITNQDLGSTKSWKKYEHVDENVTKYSN